MDKFTLITGLASLFGFAIQAFDLFPKFGRARQTIFLLLVGVFIGSLLRAIDPSSLKLNLQVTGFTIVIALFATVIIGFLMAAAFSIDVNRRNEFYGVAGIGFIVFMFLLFFGTLITGKVVSPAMEKERVTINELNILAERCLQNKDFERALMHLHTIESRVSGDEVRLKLVQEKIRQIELQELK
jgi:hypothetical protein